MTLESCASCGSPLPVGVPRCPQCGHPIPTSDSPTVSMAALGEGRDGSSNSADASPTPGIESRAAEPSTEAATVAMPALDDDALTSSGRVPLARFDGEGSAGAEPWFRPSSEAPPTPYSFDSAILSAEEVRGGTRRPEVPATLALELNTGVDQTAVEGLEPVRRLRRRGIVEADAGRRQHLRRVGPLLAVLLVGLAGLAAASFTILAARGHPSSDGPSGDATEIVALADGSFSLGLTDDNKESVLSACFRISDNPNYECRRSYLEELGEYPARRIDLPSLRVDRYEVTNGRYEQCVGQGACAPRNLAACQLHTHRGYQLNAVIPERMLGDDLPAICVTRDEAEAFCEWADGRLPTPDEWERMARGGDERLSPWGELWAPSLMNWAETDMGGFPVVGRLDGYDLTAPVTRFEDGETPDGVLNTYGNVAEWVAADPAWPDGTRGGAYSDDLREYRITYQRPLRPDARRSDVGLRCVYP